MVYLTRRVSHKHHAPRGVKKQNKKVVRIEYRNNILYERSITKETNYIM